MVLDDPSPLHLSTYLSTRLEILATAIYQLLPRLLDVVGFAP
jgi:hypothetical protein